MRENLVDFKGGDIMPLTIGQALDMLKSGQIAEFKTKYKTGYVKRLGNTIVYCDKDGNEIMEDEEKNIVRNVILDKGIMTAEWRIFTKKYVSFEEAKAAYEQGKIISSTFNNFTTYYKMEDDGYYYSVDKLTWTHHYSPLSWREILEAKWAIEN